MQAHSITKRRMLETMPPYYRDSPQANAILDGQASEIARRQAEADDLLEQMLVTNATWSLDKYEEIFAIKNNPSRTLQERRDLIIAKMRGASPTTLAVLKSVVNAFVANQDADVTLDNPRYTIYAEIPADGAINVGNMQNAINEIKPAHLAFEARANISDGLILRGKEYGFDVPLPICNMFGCDRGEGIAIRDNMTISTNERDFIVPLPITDRFTTDRIDGVGVIDRISAEMLERSFDISLPKTDGFATEQVDGIAVKGALKATTDEREYLVAQPVTNMLLPKGD